MKVIIVGGVAGGASCAARLRSLDEETDCFTHAPIAKLAALFS